MSLVVGHWTVRDYDRAIERGVFGPEPRIELLRGEIYEVSPISPRHADIVPRLDALARSVDGFEVGCRCPITISDHSEPEPDLWLARHPGAGSANRTEGTVRNVESGLSVVVNELLN